MDKTIKEIAKELCVSKQAVYKRYKGKLHTVCAPYAHTVNGVLYLADQGVEIIRQDFAAKPCSTPSGAHTERIRCAPTEQPQSDAIVEVLQTTINTLQQQLEIKDRQIERQAATIEHLSSALSAAQALHAGTIKHQLTAGHEQGAIATDGRKGTSWLSRILRKK